jgi:hypothetical protein
MIPPDENKRRSIESRRSPMRASAVELIAEKTNPAQSAPRTNDGLEYFIIEVMYLNTLTARD